MSDKILPQVEELQTLASQLAAPLSADQAAYVQGSQQQQQKAGTATCFGAGLKVCLEEESSLPGEEELAYLAQPLPAASRPQLSFSLDALQAAAMPKGRAAEGVGAEWLEQLVASFYGDEQPLGKKSTVSSCCYPFPTSDLLLHSAFFVKCFLPLSVNG